MSEKVRLACVQYAISPITDISECLAQLTSVVATAADYKADFVMLPEYFSVQLLTLAKGTTVPERLRFACGFEQVICQHLQQLAVQHRITIIGGTLPVMDHQKLLNRCYVFAASGQIDYQDKVHMTRFEEDWGVVGGQGIKIFSLPTCTFGIAICYDVEFPELVRTMAHQGIDILFVPSCTDDRMGFLRVRYCAQARAIENQIYVAHTGTIGGLPALPELALNYGQASVLTPSDFGFARDGIVAEGTANIPEILVADVDLAILRQSRQNGTVRTLQDSKKTPDMVKEFHHIRLF